MTTRAAAPFWTPDAETLARAQVTKLIERLGVADFGALCDFARLHPDGYWRSLMEPLGIVWSKPTHGLFH